MASHLLSVTRGDRLADLEKRVSFSGKALRDTEHRERTAPGCQGGKKRLKKKKSVWLSIKNVQVHLNHSSKFIMIKS